MKWSPDVRPEFVSVESFHSLERPVRVRGTLSILNPHGRWPRDIGSHGSGFDPTTVPNQNESHLIVVG